MINKTFYQIFQIFLVLKPFLPRSGSVTGSVTHFCQILDPDPNGAEPQHGLPASFLCFY